MHEALVEYTTLVEYIRLF